MSVLMDLRKFLVHLPEGEQLGCLQPAARLVVLLVVGIILFFGATHATPLSSLSLALSINARNRLLSVVAVSFPIGQ